ncbi:hypothetical protein [Saccharopolyspora mangrovi]|uniref:Uncharacterized protein n=1 Tax=Saccharopolyspora mangrovi TaxID=3082379 RepID=A0ABU6A7C0_9PSEU|nr:hypothetical protein [Saccharopolyspora sp. S2-29]MEB3367406.1 hypothetical protein [Saccharopolyspora sp. S2-29]
MSSDDEQLYTVVARGKRLEALEAYRDALAAEMERLRFSQSANEAAGRDFSIMGKELRQVMAEIDEIGGVAEGDLLDELSKRRSERRSGA